MENQMTVTEALRITANNLGNIAVPISMMQQIGLPINQAIGNINACIEALEAAEQEAKQQQEPELHVVQEEEAPAGEGDA